MNLPSQLALDAIAFAGCVPAGSAHRAPAPVDAEAPVAGVDTVYVAPPTGERQTDRASIVAALEKVEPGGTVALAPGRISWAGSTSMSACPASRVSSIRT